LDAEILPKFYICESSLFMIQDFAVACVIWNMNVTTYLALLYFGTNYGTFWYRNTIGS